MAFQHPTAPGRISTFGTTASGQPGRRRCRCGRRERGNRDNRDEGGSDGAPSSDDRLVYARPQMPIPAVATRRTVADDRRSRAAAPGARPRSPRRGTRAAAQPNGTGDTHGAPGLSVFASAMVLLRRTVGQGRSVRTRWVAGSGQENDDLRRQARLPKRSRGQAPVGTQPGRRRRDGSHEESAAAALARRGRRRHADRGEHRPGLRPPTAPASARRR